MKSNLERMRSYLKQRISSIEAFNKEMNHNFLVIKNDSISYTGSWYGPPDPPPSQETFSYMSILGFETIADVEEYLLDETRDNRNKLSNYKVIEAQYFDVKSSVSVAVTAK